VTAMRLNAQVSWPLRVAIGLFAGTVGWDGHPAPAGEAKPTPRALATPSRASISTLPARGCPRTPGGRKAPKVAISLGDGPAYPVLGMTAPPPARGGVASLDSDLHTHGFIAHKTLWAISPTVRSDLVVRARKLRSRQPVRFLYGSRTPTVHRTLRLPRPGRHWSYAVTSTLLPSAGCYVFHVLGRGVHEHIVFKAVTTPPR
jgi:hypothetical protein